jgi:thiamine biosynthesis lipoprotein
MSDRANTMTVPITRRRAIRIAAAAAGLALWPFAAARAAAGLASWRGTVMGALAAIDIHHPDRAFAERLIARCVAEAARLERLFSLYRRDSALVSLNRNGALAAPAPELVALLSEARRYSDLTDGAFDVTVQPLWETYWRHFTAPGASAAGPAAEAIAAAVGRVGYAHLLVDRDRIAFARAGMGVTLNGIAQGYMTDRVVELLRAEGIAQTLVDMGETRCLGTHPSGRPWRVGIADPDAAGRTRQYLSVVDRAVATSGGYGFRFDRDGRFNHLFDPKTGASAHAYRSVTVVAPTATAADALSTAFNLMAPPDIDRTLKQLRDVSAYLILDDGKTIERPHTP